MWSHRDRFFYLIVCIGRDSSWSRVAVDWSYLCSWVGTCWPWGAVESDLLIEIVIFFGGFGVDGKVFFDSLVALDNIVVVIFPGAIIHVFDAGQHLFFHWYSIIRRYIYDYNSSLITFNTILLLFSIFVTFFEIFQSSLFWF